MHIYLYFDRGSADDIELARSFGSRVTVSASLLSGVPVRSMQMLNVRDAIAIARREFDWLLHIDDDELFHVRRGNLDDVFTGVGDAVCQLHFENLEVVRTKDSLARYDYFKDERYFKRRQNGPPFLSYWNGKSAGNLRSSRLWPHGTF